MLDLTACPLAEALRERYRLERELGRGGMATVYLARDLKHERPVALKVLRPELAAALGAERFLREIRLTAQLHHPHILPLLDSGEAAGLLWYTMPYVEGESLRARLDRQRQLPVQEALQIARNVLAALAYAHSHGVIHRDIKPENILLDSGEAVVADFGIARAIGAAGGEHLTQTGMSVGTPLYMSPEQAGGSRELDARSDLYSLGCVVYEMLAGEPPFTGRTPQAIIARRLSEPPLPVRRLRAAVPAALDQAVARALAREPVDRFPSAAEFGRALGTALAPPTTEALEGGRAAEQPSPSATVPSAGRRRHPHSRVLLLGLGLLVALGAAASALLWRSRAPPAVLEANLVAVAPFDVLNPGLTLWHEGLVDVLSRDLDGAGPLRTVSPTVIVRRWRGRADPSSAQALGRQTGAGLAVYGSVVRSGADSVRLAATVLDVARGRALGELEVRGPVGHMDHLLDSLAVGLLRELGRTRPVGAVRHAGIGARSLPALRAFLRAEQHYRRGGWDSARVYAEQAVALDTAFALAYRRLGGAIGWQVNRTEADAPLPAMYTMRGGALNRGLAPRDSLLVLADSLTGALSGNDVVSRPPIAERLFGTLEQAVGRHPEDPEAWYALGEARHHFGRWLVHPGGWRATLEAFERSIALDPLFGPAYVHPVEVSYDLGDTARARRFAAAAIRVDPQCTQCRAYQAVQQLLALPDSAAQARVLDTLPVEVLRIAFVTIERWPDPGELAVRMLRHLWPRDRPFAQAHLAQALTFRGHLRDALALADTAAPASPLLFAEAALLGSVPADRAAAAFSAWLRERSLSWLVLALPWWSARQDTVALRGFLYLVDNAAGSARSAGERALSDSVPFGHMMALARAHLALARRDTAAALRTYDSLLISPVPCPWRCQGDQLLAARLLVGRGRLSEAARILSTPPTLEGEYEPRPSDILWYLERGRVAEQLGDRPRALEAYRYVAAAWRRPDPELEPYAAEARTALARLSAEPER